MRYFGKTKKNAVVLAVAIVATLAVRLTVYAEDCNLVVMTMTLVAIYTALVTAITLWELITTKR